MKEKGVDPDEIVSAVERSASKSNRAMGAIAAEI